MNVQKVNGKTQLDANFPRVVRIDAVHLQLDRKHVCVSWGVMNPFHKCTETRGKKRETKEK